MMTVTGGTIAQQFGVYFGSSFSGVFVFFKNQNSSALTQYKTISVLVKRPAGFGGIVIAGTQ
jgi:hypothetical protein